MNISKDLLDDINDLIEKHKLDILEWVLIPRPKDPYIEPTHIEINLKLLAKIDG